MIVKRGKCDLSGAELSSDSVKKRFWAFLRSATTDFPQFSLCKIFLLLSIVNLNFDPCFWLNSPFLTHSHWKDWNMMLICRLCEESNDCMNMTRLNKKSDHAWFLKISFYLFESIGRYLYRYHSVSIYYIQRCIAKVQTHTHTPKTNNLDVTIYILSM